MVLNSGYLGYNRELLGGAGGLQPPLTPNALSSLKGFRVRDILAVDKKV